MRDPSNKTIIALLLVALAITIAGTIVSINKVMELRGSYGLLTSAATSSSTGQTNLTITATTSITNQNNTINFGSGRVNASCNFCAMDSNNTVTNLYANGSNITGLAGSQCCVSFTPVTDGFLIENTGNVNISVGYTCSGNCTHLLFIGGSRYPGMGGLEIRVVPNSIGVQVGDSLVDSLLSCQGGGTYYRDSSWNVTNDSSYSQSAFGGVRNSVYTSLSSLGHWLCGNNTHYPLEATNTRDAAVVDINITIPADAIGTGVQSSFTLTFNGTSAG